MVFIKKAALVSSGQIVGHVFTLLTGIIFARIMGPEGIGQLEVFRSFQSVIVTLFALGIGNASIYFINHVGVNISDLLATTLRASAALSAGLLLTVGLVVWYFPNYFGPVAIQTILVYAAGTSFSLLTLTAKTVLTAQLNAGRMVIVDQTPKLIILICCLVGWLASIINVNFGLYAITLGNFCALLALVFFLQNHIDLRRKFSRGLLKKVVVYGIKLSACDILFILNANISVIMLKYFQADNFSQIGIYSRAVSISSMVSLIPYTIGPLLYAKLSSRPGSRLIGSTQYALRLTLFLGILMSVFVYLFRSQIILVLYGSRFLAAEVVIRVLAGSLIFYCVSNVCLNFLAGQGMAGLNAKILCVAFITIVVVSYAGIKMGGIEGAAYGILAGNIITSILGIYYCQKLFGLRISESLIIRIEDLSNLMKSIGWQKHKIQI
jgi:O-antigen/teichoic acid export membrane protein